MSLLREINEQTPGPAVPEDGWNVGHLANHGILLSCDGFSMKLDIDQLNVLFDLAEDGEAGEVRDHQGKVVFVEPATDGIILTRDDDEVYPNGIKVDLKTLKEIGIEKDEAPDDEAQPADDGEVTDDDDTIDADTEEEEEGELKEGVKRAFRRAGKKIKRGFRVTSGFRKGRVVANIKNAFKPRAKAKTRMKLKIAAKRKKIIRVLKGKRTRRKPLSKRLVKMNKRLP